MSVLVLPGRPAAPPPLTCDPEAVDRFGRDLELSSGDLDDLGTDAATALLRVPDWDSEAGGEFHRSVGEIGDEADAMSLALRHVGRRVREHSDTLRTLVRERDGLVDAVVEIDHALTELAARVVPIEQLPAVQAEADDLGRRIQRLKTEIDAWAERARAEDAEMAAAFRALTTLGQVRGRYGGQPDPADAARARMPHGDPAAIREWWDSLTEEERHALIHADPDLIGNTDGIPAQVRDQANRIALDRDLSYWGTLAEQGLLTRQEQKWFDNAQAALDALAIADAHEGPFGERPGGYLLAYDPAAFGGDGAVAVALGDVDTADNVSVSVPGLTSNMQSIAGNVQGDLANLYGAAAFADPDATTASVMWIGYDAPDGMEIPRVAFEGMARAGGEHLADFLDGLRASRADEVDRANLTVIGHSYGSTTTGYALSQYDVDVDRAVFIGSPGLGGGVNHVSDLSVPAGEVFVGTNSLDPVGGLGDKGWVNKGTLFGLGLGRDPSEDRFEATRFQAEDPGKHSLVPGPIAMHTSYYDPNTESLANMASLVTGQGVLTEAAHKYDPLFGGPKDPERGREATELHTHRDGPEDQRAFGVRR
ncbi:alpha/beta hydrolase [Nocardioides limicola]|uniref:alpha/beta hydrolase n=1 Tax=Nocardioides limicola TaxID=2803368 RepID=UPI00193BE8F4|nr:alpha/beta hydrolase [Nocardioides sp. DJM-14]